PPDFVWGASTSSYQIEGAWNEDGKGENIWDRFCHTPYHVAHGDTGDVACDHYHRMPEDVDLMAWMELKSYRFSISWARVLPVGTGKVNEKGLDFYERLVDRLLENGIEPNATLNHWDFPQALQEKGGWANPQVTDWFTEYADVMFRRLGDRVAYWATHNEPKVVAIHGYYDGNFAPGRQSVREALLAVHHINIGHGKVVQLFRAGNYAGKIGTVIDVHNFEPASSNEADLLANQRYMELNKNLFLDPVLKGKYPTYLLEWLGDLVPQALYEDVSIAATPIDFLGMNYYFTFKTRHSPHGGLLRTQTDLSQSADGFGQNAMGWGIDPIGLYKVLKDLKENYANPRVMIAENGTPAHDVVEADGSINDLARIRYLREHILAVHDAMQEGANVGGYYVWSLMDNFEWGSGYAPRFGLIHVDRETLERTPKRSAHWYQRLIKKNKLYL
ncbi:MAG: GH1 family beta-glucosidase, partial [Anaerolineae bacterium]|nr:GH1 family beta-glucosidase [Anaerolineae bacterium]